MAGFRAAFRSRKPDPGEAGRPETGEKPNKSPQQIPGYESNSKRPPVGLFQLWPDPDSESASKIQTDIDLIAVHGLGGHPLKTWRDGDNVWLRDFLPWELPKARVLVFGYNSKVAFTDSTSSVRDFASQLLEGIKQLRRRNDEEDAERKIVFVCHSLGGIVFKQALVIAHERQSRYGAIGESVTGVVFLGTPHRGADIAYWSKILARFANAVVGGQFRDDLLANLEPKSRELGLVCSQFVERGMRLQIFSVYEQLATPKLRSLVVDKTSAILHLPNETPIGLDTDHRGMCKYLSSSDSNYRSVFNCIVELVDASLGPLRYSGHILREREFVSNLKAVNASKVLDLIPIHWGQSSVWLQQHADFQSWTNLQGFQVIWLHGPPGSGKTVLMRSIVAYLMEQSDSSDESVIRKPLHFFFDDKDATRTTSVAFVRSMLDQILTDDRTAFVIRYLDHRPHREDVQSEDGLWACLSIIIQRSRGIVFQFVVDAVDEVLRSNTGMTLTVLDRLHQLLALDSSGRIRLLISDRKSPPYEFSATADISAINVDNGSTSENVESFVRSQVRKTLERHRISPKAGEEVEKKIIKISRGNFLHAKLAWEQFCKGVTVWSRGQISAGLLRLDDVSHDLITTYCRLLSSIPESYRSKAATSFAILRVAQGKLTSRQLAFFATLHSLKMQAKRSILTELDPLCDDFENYLLEACGYIIRITKDGTVDFAHVSARDLFAKDTDGLSPENRRIISAYAVSSIDAHAILHTLCMRIFQVEDRDSTLWFKDFTTVTNANQEAVLSAAGDDILTAKEAHKVYLAALASIRSIAQTPCFTYALQNWVIHYEYGASTADIDMAAASFLSSIVGYYCHVLWYAVKGHDGSYLTTYSKAHSGADSSATGALFRVIARGDCPRLVKILLEQGANINCVSDEQQGVTPLSWAIICQRQQCFRTILRNENARINYGTAGTKKPIHHAAQCMDDPSYIQTLVRHPDTNVNIMCDTGSPLHVALHMENTLAVDILISHSEIDIRVKDRDGDSPYTQAFRHREWESVIETFIKMEDVTALTTDIHGMSQFLLAGINGWTNVEESILRSNPRQVLMIDPNTKMNALISYAYFGRKEKLLWILDRLPSSGIVLRNVDDKYDLLHLCANQDWEEIVHLLRRRYRLSSLPSDHRGRTLLHWALEWNWDMGRFSLEDYSASNIDAQDLDGLTAMHIAVVNRNMAAVEILAASGADCFLKDKKGMSPAHLAADFGFREALEYFIEMPEREFGRNRDGASLLHLISLWFDGALARRFVKAKKALVNVVDKYRRTPLHYAAMADNLSSAEQLVQLGCMINARNDVGMSALHEAIRGGAVHTAQLLVRLGADTRAIDHFDQSCLHLSLRHGHDDLVAQFLRLNADVNAADIFGMSPLHRACATGNAKYIRKLLRMGVDWGSENIHRRIPLALAVECNRLEAAEVMLNWLSGSAMSDRKRRRTLGDALKLAIEADHTAMEKLLLDEGAEVDRARIKSRRQYMPGANPEDDQARMLVVWDREAHYQLPSFLISPSQA